MKQMHIRIRTLERKVILSDYADFCLSNGIPESQVESHVKIFDSYRRSKNFNGSTYSHEFSKNDYTIDNDDLLDLPVDYRTEDVMSTFSDSWEVKCAKFKEQNNIPKDHVVMPKKNNDISSAPIIKHSQAKQVVAQPTRLQQATSFVKKAVIAAPVAVAAGYVAKKAYDNYNASEAKTTEVVDWNSIFSPPTSSEPMKQAEAKPATPLLPQFSKPLPALVDSSFKDKTFDSHDNAYESLKRYFESKGFSFNVTDVYKYINVDRCSGKAWVLPNKVSNEQSNYSEKLSDIVKIEPKSDIANLGDFQSVITTETEPTKEISEEITPYIQPTESFRQKFVREYRGYNGKAPFHSKSSAETAVQRFATKFGYNVPDDIVKQVGDDFEIR